MRKQVKESTAAESARRATRPAAERDRKGRFSARRKRATVLRLLRGENLESVSRELGITAPRASQWRDQFLAAGQAGLKSRAPDARDEEHQRLHAKVGELLMENELLYAKVDHLEAGGPLARRSRRDEWRPVDLRPSGVRRTTGLPRVGTGRGPASTCDGTRRGRAPHGAAGRSVPPRTRCWSATSAGCSRPHRFMAKGTGKRGRSCGSRGSAPRRNGCDG